MNYNTDNKTDTIYQPTIYQYANIIIDISHESVDKTFQYRIPEHLLGQITAGQQVYIPFGAGSHKRKGYVVELTNQTEYDISKIKEIDSLVEGSITAQSQLIHLAWWMKERYGSTMNQALKTVLPVKQKVREAPKRKIHLLVDALTLEAAIQTAERKKYKARLRLLYALKENPDLPYENTLHKLNLTAAAIRPLEQEGLLAVQVVNQYRNPLEEMRRLLTDASKAQWKPPVLNKDQQRITAIGVSYLLQNVALLIFGADTKSFTSVVKIPALKLADGQLNITGETIATILSCIVIMVCLMAFINRTRAGQAMLAVS